MNRGIRFFTKHCNEIIYLLCIAVTGVLTASGIAGYSWHAAAITGSVTVWLLLFFLTKRNTNGWILWAGVALLAVGVALYLYQKELDFAPYLLFMQWEAVCLIAAAGAWLCRRWFWLKVPVLIAEMGGFVYCAIKGIPLPGWAVCMGLFCVLMLICELAERKTHRSGGLDPLLLTPVFLFLLLLIGFLPVRETPAEWRALKDAWGRMQEKAAVFIAEVQYRFSGMGSDFELPFLGYGGNGGIGGSIYSNDQKQISVKTDRMQSPLYVTGSIYDVYTGDGWEKTSAAQESYLKPYETLHEAFAQSVYTGEEIGEMTRKHICELTYEGIRTETLFLMPLTEQFYLPENEKILQTDGGNIRLKKAKGVGYTYRVKFLEVDYGSEKIKRLLRQEAWSAPQTLSEEEQKAQDARYAAYTNLPDSVPGRVYALADEITADAQTDYDKLAAIEAYLKRFTYTTRMQKAPGGQDAVDYFLFESRSGYCTYFASAMAVLARCEGIPVRYAEGFVTGDVKETSHETLMVTGNQAHAWVEAYIPHVGWIPFEPTPGFECAAAWEKPKEPAVQPGVNQPEEVKETAEVTEKAAGEEPDDGADADTLKRLMQAAAVALRVLLWGLVFCGILTLLFVGRRRMRNRRYRRMPEIEKRKELLRRVFAIGALLGLELSQGETLLDYERRSAGKLDTAEGTFLSFCEAYEAARFGAHLPGQEAVFAAERYAAALETSYLETCSFPARLLYYVR